MFRAKENADLNFSSFHGVTIKTTPLELIRVFGQPHDEDIDGKVQMEWAFEALDNKNLTFSVYDWKTSFKIKPTDLVEFHIGSRSTATEDKQFKHWLEKQFLAKDLKEA